MLIHYSGSNQLHLALLHSCELVVYLLSTEQNNEGPVYMLNLVYKHSLPRTACNMTWGPFGGNKGTVFTDYNRVPPPPPPSLNKILLHTHGQHVMNSTILERSSL
jgi:hypothetical protein